MRSTVISILLLFIGYIVALFAWRRLRLRRALYMLRKQVIWSIKHAPRDKFVLEVGSGNNPHLRADMLCEKYIYDDFHRGAGVATDRPLVAGDASALPFKTGIFDIIISNHVIEHLEDPGSFFQEAGRVADSGLFITPNALAERIQSFGTHLWLITQKGDTLHFAAKKQRIIDPTLHRFFNNEVMSSLLKLDNFSLDHWDSLNITYSWTGQPECVVEGEPNVSSTDGFVQASTVEPTVTHKPMGLESLRAFLKKWVRITIHALFSSHYKVDWVDILACPKCHRDVSVSTSKVYCPACELRFPIERGIPIMLLDHAVAGSNPLRYD